MCQNALKQMMMTHTLETRWRRLYQTPDATLFCTYMRRSTSSNIIALVNVIPIAGQSEDFLDK